MSPQHSEMLQRANSTVTDDSVTKKQYAEQVKLYSERVKEAQVFSGEHYKTLAQFLENAPPAQGWRTYSGQEETFFPLYVHVNRAGSDKTQVVAYRSSDDVRSTTSSLTTSTNSPTAQLMFLRGWQSREWIRKLGAQCKIDPEFFRRHLDFLDSASYFDIPALPSACQNIWRLRVTTICSREHPLSADSVKEQRKDDIDSVRKYLNSVRAGERIGSSIVRRHAIINETTYIIEQDISFCVQQKKSGDWIGFVWLDQGGPFDEHTDAPWLERSKTKFSFHDPYLPIIQHLDNMALSPLNAEHLEVSSPTKQYSPSPGTPPTVQSANNLTAEYGVSLKRALMRVDALYSFSELFKISLCSENQFLNMIQAEIAVAIRSFQGQEQSCVDTISYCKLLVDEHADRLREMVNLLEDENTGWPKATEGASLVVRDRVVKSLRKDSRHLLRRCYVISKRAIEGTDFIRNHGMLVTAEKSISLAKEVRRFSLIATLFLPLSFVATVFGMNFVEFRDWVQALVTTLPVFIFVTAISLTICFWDYRPCITPSRKLGKSTSTH